MSARAQRLAQTALTIVAIIVLQLRAVPDDAGVPDRALLRNPYLTQAKIEQAARRLGPGQAAHPGSADRLCRRRP